MASMHFYERLEKAYDLCFRQDVKIVLGGGQGSIFVTTVEKNQPLREYLGQRRVA